MKKEEFINWLEKEGWERLGEDDWRYLQNWPDTIYDYLEIENDKVIFKYENEDGYLESEEYGFESFIEFKN
jgi:hypothetical protein